MFCAICVSLQRYATAVAYCLECTFPEPLCDECAEEHTSMKRSKNHTMFKDTNGLKLIDFPGIVDDIHQSLLVQDLISRFESFIDSSNTTTRLDRNIKIDSSSLEKKASNCLTIQPGRPHVSASDDAVLQNAFILQWHEHLHLEDNESYQVKYKENPTGKWFIYEDETSILQPSTMIRGLKPNTSFTFKVRITNCQTSEEGPFSKESEIIETKTSTTDFLMSRSELIQQKGPRIYMLPKSEVNSFRDEFHLTRKYVLGSAGKDDTEKKVLMVGSTGSGKSTLINAMVNYILGVTWEDPYRFKLINLEKKQDNTCTGQATSQTEWVTSYTIYKDVSSRIDFNVTLIDTPGFGDTNGLDKDSKTISQVRHLFTDCKKQALNTIDAVCFIVKSPDARLTESQKYIFESISALFGKDLRENVYSLITFADGQIPPVLSALEAFDGCSLPFKSYYTFNNSAFFVDNMYKDDTFSKSFWNMGMNSCKYFFRSLKEIKPINLSMTSTVLITRSQLEITASLLVNDIQIGLEKVRTLEDDLKKFRVYTIIMKDNENFEQTVVDTKIKTIDISGQGIHTTTCLNCSFTCHENCSKLKDEEKEKCSVMDKNGKCTKCPKNCSWQHHSNTQYIFEQDLVGTKKTNDAMSTVFQNALIKRAAKARKISETCDEIIQIKFCLQSKNESIESYIKKLHAIALHPELKSVSAYIDLLIETELREKKPDFNNRIEELYNARKQNNITEHFTDCICQFDVALKAADELLKSDSNVLK